MAQPKKTLANITKDETIDLGGGFIVEAGRTIVVPAILTDQPHVAARIRNEHLEVIVDTDPKKPAKKKKDAPEDLLPPDDMDAE